MHKLEDACPQTEERSPSPWLQRAWLVPLVLASTASSVHADGIDLSVWFTRAFLHTSAGWTLVLMVGLMLVNYVTNALVIALPASRTGAIPLRAALHETIGLTLLGQLADRLGALAALLLSLPILWLEDVLSPDAVATEVNPIPGLTIMVVTLGVVGVLCSGFVVGSLAFHFARRRWGVEKRPARRIAMVAGILTNPLLWALAAGFGPIRGAVRDVP